MSHRPIEQKKRNRIAKMIRRQPLPAYFDLVQWLIDHGHARSKKEAREIILDKRVKANSHPVGFDTMQVFEAGKLLEKDVVCPHVRVELKPDIVVSS